MKSFKSPKQQLKIENNDPAEDRYFNLAKNANNWRKISFCLIVLSVFLGAGLVKSATERKIETFVLEKNGNNYSVVGKVNDLSKQQEKASEQEIIYFLNEVIDNTKGLPRNNEIYEKNYKKSLAFLSKSASKKIDNYLKAEKYVEKFQNGKTVEIAFNTGDKISDNTYQIRWKQSTYTKNGELESQINYSAIITIGFNEITDSKMLYINPLGLMIVDFSQKEELL